MGPPRSSSRRATGWAAAPGRTAGTTPTSSSAAAGCTGISRTSGRRSRVPGSASSSARTRRSRAGSWATSAARGRSRSATRLRERGWDKFVDGVEEALPLPHDPLLSARQAGALRPADDRGARRRARPRRGGARRALGRARVACTRASGRRRRGCGASLARALGRQPRAHAADGRPHHLPRRDAEPRAGDLDEGAVRDAAWARRSPRSRRGPAASRCTRARARPSRPGRSWWRCR